MQPYKHNCATLPKPKEYEAEPKKHLVTRAARRARQSPALGLVLDSAAVIMGTILTAPMPLCAIGIGRSQSRTDVSGGALLRFGSRRARESPGILSCSSLANL
jgi:hypothetical protein